MNELTTPRALNHVGITVPDIHAAIDWYGRVFGFRRIMGPRRLEAKLSGTENPGISWAHASVRRCRHIW